MYIPENEIVEFKDFSRPVIFYRDPDGKFLFGRVLRADEIITTFTAFKECCELAGLYIVDSDGRRV